MIQHTPSQRVASGEGLAPSVPQSDQDLLHDVQRLMTDPSGDFKTTLLKEMIASVLKLQESDIDVLDVKILHRAMKELRHAFTVFHPYQHIRKVSIFGSARIPPEDPNFQLAHRFARLLSERDFMVITGAGPGIMWAGHEGAGRDHSFGVNILLPFEQSPNSLIADDKKLVNFKYFFSRKLLFVKESHATALFPGGFGTLDEGFEVLTLIQTGKTNPTPVVFLEAPGCDYWERWLDFIRQQLLSRALIHDSDLALFKVFHEAEAAVEEIQTFYHRYHSLRFVNDHLAIRLQQALTDDQLKRVNSEFNDLLEEGTFRQSSALLQEQDEPELSLLSRLVFHYNRQDAGRLRKLIDWLNALPA